jgi:hypothetical protein
MSVEVEASQPPITNHNEVKTEAPIPELWVDVYKAAPALGVTPEQLYRSVRAGHCPVRYVRVGTKLLRFNARDLGLLEGEGK